MKPEEMTDEEFRALVECLMAELCPDCYDIWINLCASELEEEDE